MRKMLALALFAAAPAWAAPGGVAGSKHDFSVTGPGPIRATEERQVCVFCHTSHGAAAGMSNRPDAAAGHRGYESSTMKNRPGAPTGASRICLSCHDGTIAVGQTRNGRIRMTGGGSDGLIPGARRSNLGTDLRGTHPISFTPGAARGTRAPKGKAHLDRRGEVQCTSCHDPHSEFGGTSEGKFLLESASALCVDCHLPSPGSAHATSVAPLGAADPGAGQYATVAAAGCAACHQPHAAAKTGRLLAKGDGDAPDAVCLRCHGGRVAATDLRADLAKPSTHSVDPERHEASEGPDSPTARLPETSAGAPRHAACVDCHDAHQAGARPAVAPAAGGALAGAWGIELAGRRVSPARFEYEVCLKCHGDGANVRRRASSAYSQIRRAHDEPNLRRAFGDGAVSFHPVAAPGRSADVPGLRPPYTPASYVYCTDCHASDTGAGAGGRGPRGPHGSAYPALLERNYSTGERVIESPTAYALCYKCHDRAVLLSSRSTFTLHQKHVVDGQAPCSVCHASHGVAGSGANPVRNAHLVDFDLSVVQPGPGGRREYEARGAGAGNCTLTCHTKRHDTAAY